MKNNLTPTHAILGACVFGSTLLALLFPADFTVGYALGCLATACVVVVFGGK